MASCLLSQLGIKLISGSQPYLCDRAGRISGWISPDKSSKPTFKRRAVLQLVLHETTLGLNVASADGVSNRNAYPAIGHSID